MTAHAYFFPHPRKPGRQPGRVPYRVRGPLVGGESAVDSEFIVCADGYGENVVGTNQDPCVFCDPLGPFLSFCRIDRDDVAHRVDGTGKLLSHAAHPNDVIVFGKYEPAGSDGPTRCIWIDTVLVVRETVRWPGSQQGPQREPCNRKRLTNPKDKEVCKRYPFRCSDPAGLLKRLSGVEEPRRADAYQYNLRDAERDGMHCCTSLDDYRVILGSVEPTHDAVQRLTTSFVTLARRGPDGKEWWPTWVDADCFTDQRVWSELCDTIDRRTRRRVRGVENKGTITRFPLDIAKALCEALVRYSGVDQGGGGRVAVPPLHPVEISRHDPCA